jgi:hypothetical protein
MGNVSTSESPAEMTGEGMSHGKWVATCFPFLERTDNANVIVWEKTEKARRLSCHQKSM